MNKALKKQRGAFLVAMLLHISLVSILFAGAAGCFFTLCKMHREFVGSMVVQEQVRFAAENLRGDLARAKSVKIENGRLTLYAANAASQRSVYELKGEKLVKDNQPVTGSDKDSAAAIEQFSCRRFKENVIFICIKARNKNNGKAFSVETGAFLPFLENGQGQ